MSKALIVVESPAKARTISRFLGSDYVVEPSIGHIRDLPSKAAEIPAAHRKEPWARIGVDVENDFEPLYIVPTAKKAQVKKLKSLLADADALYLATDEDREGEAIAWHLVEVLKPKVPVRRMVFHEITKRAIQHALDNPRDIDMRLVEAQEARRILDRLYGYELSPVLWLKIKPRLSAGRVQSVATRLVVERERERIRFVSAEYWSMHGVLRPEGEVKEKVAANLMEVGGRRIAAGRDFDQNTGKLSENALKDHVLQLNGDVASAIEADLVDKDFKVIQVNKKPFTQRPQPPFITSTLQQEAGRKLRFTANRTMRVAQRLYENGYITYMRTDSPNLSGQALNAARTQVEELYGKEYVPEEPRHYKSKVKGAQEAHEAIRPAGEVFRTPEGVRGELDEEALKLYELIWKRTLACQMCDARGFKTQIRFRAQLSPLQIDDVSLAGAAIFSANGKVIDFPGFLRAYVEGSDDPEAELEEKERLLPPLEEGEHLKAESLSAEEHHTKSPARYTEASLVKTLEARGIGRPSTYASIIQTIQNRGYVWKKGGALVPTLTAFAVVRLLEEHFGKLVDYAFTARMESDLDVISSGEKEATPWLKTFYFGSANEDVEVEEGGVDAVDQVGLKGKIAKGFEDIDARGVCSVVIGTVSSGETIAARVGRYGGYIQIGDTDKRASIPDEQVLDELTVQEAQRLLDLSARANRILGEDTTTGQPVYLKSGRYGAYIQLGDPELTKSGNIKKGSKPKMVSLWPDKEPESLTLEDAMVMLSFPRVLGKHPDHDVEITIQDGRFGPYISMEVEGKKESRRLEGHAQLVTLTLDEALALFKEKPARGRRQSQGPLAVLAESPVTGKPIEVRTGRFGPYVTDGQVNATIPTVRDPLTITFDDALELIAMREERMRGQGKEPRPAAAGGKATKKKTTKKKVSKKKTTKKKTTKKKTTKKKASKKKASKKKAAKAAPDA